MKNALISIWQYLWEVIFFSKIQIIGNQLCPFCEQPFGVPRFLWCCCDAFQPPLLLCPVWCFQKGLGAGCSSGECLSLFGHCSPFFCLGAEEKYSDYFKSFQGKKKKQTGKVSRSYVFSTFLWEWSWCHLLSCYSLVFRQTGIATNIFSTSLAIFSFPFLNRIWLSISFKFQPSMCSAVVMKRFNISQCSCEN